MRVDPSDPVRPPQAAPGLGSRCKPLFVFHWGDKRCVVTTTANTGVVATEGNERMEALLTAALTAAVLALVELIVKEIYIAVRGRVVLA